MRKRKTNWKVRAAAWLLSLAMIVQMMPVSVMASVEEIPEFTAEETLPEEAAVTEEVTAEEEETNVLVYLSAIAGNTGIFSEQQVVVPEGLSELYGYTEGQSVPEGSVTALDALIALHRIMYEDAFTKETAQEYLVVENGVIVKMFQQTVSDGAFAVNGSCPQAADKTMASASEVLLQPEDHVQFTLPDMPEESVPALTAAGEGVTIKTTLADQTVIKGRRKTFDVWARDDADQKLTPTVTLDGQDVHYNWNDDVKTSFTLDLLGLSAGEHEIYIEATDGTDTASMTLTIIYQPAQEGEFLGYAVTTVELFTISLGYLVEPTYLPIYEGDNASKALAEMLHEHGYGLTFTGTIESGFYMSSVIGSNAGSKDDTGFQPTSPLILDEAALEENIAQKVPSIAESFDPSSYTEGSLGEFDFNYMSGWMYCVNIVFPNVGYADYYLSEGDVMRTQFTVGYGTEIGGSSAMGGGIDDAYVVANKDSLTTTLAKINSSPNSEALKADEAIAAKIEEAKTILANITVPQAEVERIDQELKALLNGEVTGLSLDKETLILENEAVYQLMPQITCTGNPTATVVWSSSNEKVAAVKLGRVTAVGPGEADITATCGNFSATCKVTVPNLPLTGIQLDKTEASVNKGKKIELSVSLIPANTTDDRTVTWSSDNEEVAVVKNGTVTGIKAGTAVITATAGAFLASCKVTVLEIPLEGISLKDTEIELLKGKTKLLSVQYTPSDTTDSKTAAWSSSDPAVATVSASGSVKGVKAGTAVITAKVGAFEASCKVTVEEIPMTDVKLNYFTKSINKGKTVSLRASFVPSNTTDDKKGTWKSDNPAVATVSSSGSVKGVSAGTANITFTSSATGLSVSCPVEVRASGSTMTSSLTLDKTALELTAGTTGSVNADTGKGTDPVSWSSDNGEVAVVKDGVVTAKKLGTAVITAYSGTKSTTCKVTVKSNLAVLAFGNTKTPTIEYALTQDPTSPEKYELVVPDNLGNVFAKASLTEGLTGTIQVRYKNYSGTDRVVSLTSGAETYTSIAAAVRASSMEGNTLYIDVTLSGVTNTYEVNIVREATLSSMKIAAQDRELSMTPAFSADTAEYTVNVPDSLNKVYVQSQTTTGCPLELNKILSAESGEKLAVSVKKNTDISLEAVGDKGTSRTYTIHFVRCESAKMKFDITPQDAVITVTDSNGNKISDQGGSYSFVKGETYICTMVRTGYVAQKLSVSINEDTTQKVDLVKAADSTLKNVSSDWKNFRNSDENMAITSVNTPKSAASAYEKWAVKLGTGWAAAPSVQIIVDDALIVMSGKTIYKLNLETGEVLKQGTMAAAPSYGYTPPTYADGMIFAPLGDGTIQAFNAETLESLWIYRDSLGGQALSPIVYSDGYVYTGFWNSETAKANYVCVSVTDEDPEKTDEEKLPVWQNPQVGGFYWAGGLVKGDQLIYGTDDGTSGAEGPAKLYSVNKYTGKVTDSLDITGDQRSSIAYDETTKRAYFTTKAGYLYSVAINSDGTFDHASVVSSKPGAMSTSTPVVYKGRVYIGVSSGSNFSGKFGLSVLDAKTLEQIYLAPLNGYPQASVLLSNAYEAEDGYVYLYITYNANPGGIALIKDKAGQTEPIIEDMFIPGSGKQQYCICSVISGKDGTLYYKNDSAYVFAVAPTNAYLTGASVNTGVMDDAAAFDASADKHSIIVTPDTDKVTLTLTASQGSTVSINGQEGNFAELTVSDETVTVPVVVTNGKDTRNYEFTLRRQKQDASLKEMKVNASNGYSSFVTLTPEFSSDVYEYKYEYTSTRSFLNLWPDAADSNASVKVYPVSQIGRGDLEEDGSLEVTAKSSGHDRYALYFPAGGDCVKVKVVVTAEDKVTKREYFVILKQKSGNAPTLTAKENAGVRVDASAGTVTFTSNEYGTMYYLVKEAGEAAPESIDTTGEGTNVEVGETTLTLKALSEKAQTVYLVVKDADSTPHTSEMLAVTIPSWADELAAERKAACEELESYKNADDYRDAQKEELAQSIEAGKAAINAAENTEQIQKALKEQKAALDAIKTDAQMTEEEQKAAEALAAAKEAACQELESYKNADDYRNAQKEELAQAIESGKAAINAAETQEQTASILAEQKAALDAIKTDEQLTEEENQAAVANVEKLISAIGEVTLESEAKIQAARDAYAALSDELKKSVSNYETLTEAERNYEELTEAAKLAAAKEAACQELESYKNADDYRDAQKKELAQAIEAGKAAINKAKTPKQAASILADQKAVLDEVKTNVQLTAEENQAAVANAEKLISAIGKVTLESKNEIQAARDAYAALSEELKAEVSNYETLTEAEKTLEELTQAASLAAVKKAACEELESYKDAADYREAQKQVLTKAVAAGKTAIQAAGTKEQAASVLAEQKALLDTIKTDAQLTAEENQAAAEKVSSLIAAIGEVTLDSKGAVDSARAAYDSLSEEQKKLVSNYALLQKAETAYENLETQNSLAEAKAAAIAELDTLIDASQYAQEDAEKLTKQIAAAKEAINQAATAEEAASILEQTKNEAGRTDTLAGAVERMIAAIGEVTLESEETLVRVRNAYEALSKEHQAGVKNYSSLVDAEHALSFLQAQEKAVKEIEDYKFSGEYLPSGQAKLAQIVKSNTDAIRAAITYKEIRSICSDAEAAMDDQLVTISQMEEEMTVANVKAKAVKKKGVKVTWAPVPDASGYSIYRKSVKDKNWKQIAQVKAGTGFYKDNKTARGTGYYYAVRACKEAEGVTLESSKYAESSLVVTTLKRTKIKSVKAVGKNSVKIRWKNVKRESGYYVYRKTAKGKWKQIGKTAANKITYTDKTAKAGKTYYYSVRAYRKVADVEAKGPKAKKMKIKLAAK